MTIITSSTSVNSETDMTEVKIVDITSKTIAWVDGTFSMPVRKIQLIHWEYVL